MTSSGQNLIGGRYEIQSEIGTGTSGTAYTAFDTTLGRVVVLKKIGIAAGGGVVDVARAEREAQMASKVNHHNVVAIYDVVHEGPDRWLVTEHVDGVSLATLIADRGAIPPQLISPVISQVASALAATHAQGIVHRAVTPTNILLTPERVVKLTDFGVARAQADASLTQGGLVVGSPAYLAPEVVSGQAATPESDVWALGASMFHALTARLPYDASQDLAATMTLIVNEPPPRLTGTDAISRLVSDMMNRDPGARPTMAEVAERSAPSSDAEATQALDALAIGTAIAAADPAPTAAFRPVSAEPPRRTPPPAPPQQRPDPKKKPNRAAWIAAGAAALVLIIAGFALANRDDDSAEDTSSDSTPPAVEDAPEAEPAPEAAPEPEPEPEGPDAGELEDFIDDYLSDAEGDSQDGFDQLTPDLQNAVGGFEQYDAFWSAVDDVNVEQSQGDQGSGSVAYTFSYTMDDQEQTQSQVAQVIETDDGLRISGLS